MKEVAWQPILFIQKDHFHHWGGRSNHWLL